MKTLTALVTGAGQGIGRGIALKLAEAGYNLVLNDIIVDPNEHQRGLMEVCDQVNKLGLQCVPVRGDIARNEDHRTILKTALDIFGRIDLLVNNAGVAPRQRHDLLNTSKESYDRVMGINARGPYFFTQRVAKQMIAQVEADRTTKPMIIFITSISADFSSPSRGEYCVSKSALSMIARLYAHRLAEFGINVYELRPGIIATEMTSTVKEKYDQLIAEGLVPQARWGTPDDVGRAVVGLAGGFLAYSTGAIIEIGGGIGIPRL